MGRYEKAIEYKIKSRLFSKTKNKVEKICGANFGILAVLGSLNN